MLKASEHCCEEASPLSGSAYIPCNAPAVFMVKNRDPQPYRMCQACADHNVRNRGAKIIGPYKAEARPQKRGLQGIAAVKKRVKLKTEKDAAEAALKRITDEIAEIDPIVVEFFQRHGVDKETIDGVTVYLRRELWAGREENVDMPTACAALQEAGLPDYVEPRFNTNSLSAYARELDRQGTTIVEAHPALQGKIKISEVFKIGARG